MAPSIFIRGEGGTVFELDLPLHEAIEDRLLKGYLVRVANADGDTFVEGADGIPSLPSTRPALNAPKSEWVGWAAAQGMAPDDADALTKADLVERFGVATAASVAPPAGVPAPPVVPVEDAPAEAPTDPPVDAPADVPVDPAAA